MSLVLTWVLWALAAFLMFGTVTSFSKLKFGLVRGFDFPREQFLMFGLATAVGFAWVQPDAGWRFGLAAMLAVSAVQAFFIIKFTPLWPRQSVDADEDQRGDTDNHVSLLASNVKKSNRDYGRLIDLIRDRSPDIAMAIETDDEWIEALRDALEQDYEHWVDVPMDNGYGLCVLSRLPLKDVDVRELITENVPSIKARVRLRSGRDIRLYVVHPEPPVIDHDTVGRDSEIAMVGLEAKDDELPAIVTGDLNDVAWSTTTRQFQRLSHLLDPRVGRGFYNTFSATMPWMRWPLDHLFHCPHFRLVDMSRERKVGSDHFPMWFVLCLADTASINSDPGNADVEEIVEAKQEIAEERRRDRKPIGEDWEDEDT